MIDPKVQLEELVAQLIEDKKRLEIENKQLKRKTRYGLVWEDHPEKLDNPDIVPLLKEKEELSVYAADDKPLNYLIEGDNYHALQALERTHKGKIDVIYIDPPYNTGNEFVYNDKLVDKEDGFRHSKWLSFMYKRLRLAKRLLADDGVIFVSIDDNEQAQLKLLMDEVFGEENFVSNLIWKNRSSKQYSERFISKQTDYILLYSKNKLTWYKKNKSLNRIIDKSKFKNYKNRDNDPRGPWQSSGIIRDDGRKKYTVTSPTGKKHTQPWLYTEDNFKKLDENGEIWWGINGDSIPRRKTYLKDFKGEVSSNLLFVETNEKATKSLTDLFGKKVFDYPKPVGLIKYLVALYPDKHSIILDFFAGSGTTGHAVMELNEEDGGNRQFILCTNNEVSKNKEREYLAEKGYIEKPHKRLYNKFKKEHPEQYEAFLRSEEYEELGIARAVTRERLKRVIEGYTTPKGKEIEGLPNNLVYLKTVEGHTAFFRTVISDKSQKRGKSDD